MLPLSVRRGCLIFVIGNIGSCEWQGYSDFLVVSLGTGDDMASYQAQQVANWGLFSWIYKSGTVPLWDMVSAGGASMVDYNMAVFFEAQQCSENYLRIQVCVLAIIHEQSHL